MTARYFITHGSFSSVTGIVVSGEAPVVEGQDAAGNRTAETAREVPADEVPVMTRVAMAIAAAAAPQAPEPPPPQEVPVSIGYDEPLGKGRVAITTEGTMSVRFDIAVDRGTDEGTAYTALDSVSREWGNPSPAEARWLRTYEQALAAWCWYYATTEAYDRTVCTGEMRRRHDFVGDDWEAVPRTPAERRLIDDYARARGPELRRLFATIDGLDEATKHRAKEAAGFMTFEAQRKLAEAHGHTLQPQPAPSPVRDTVSVGGEWRAVGVVSQAEQDDLERAHDGGDIRAEARLDLIRNGRPW